jgi:hypothetical protein
VLLTGSHFKTMMVDSETGRAEHMAAPTNAAK